MQKFRPVRFQQLAVVSAYEVLCLHAVAGHLVTALSHSQLPPLELADLEEALERIQFSALT
jgi:hypothetical protein